MLTDAQREALTARLRRGRDTAAVARIPRRPAGLAGLPLSYGQEQLWFIDRFAPGQPTYNIPLALRLTGRLDTCALARAIDALTARHEALRTRLVPGDRGGPVQVVDPPAPRALLRADLSHVPAGQREARLRAIIDTAAHQPFDLASGPLLRAVLARVSERDHLLVIVVHHAVFDGWSVKILVSELAALYRQKATGEPSGLAGLPVQFADYALWERTREVGPAHEELEQYWQQVMAGFPVVEFPTDRPRPMVDDFDGGLAVRLTGPGLLGDLRDLGRREGTTLFVVLMAALHALLHRYTGQDDLVVGTVSANRARPELTPLIGFLVNTLPIRADASGDPAFTDLLARVHTATAGAFAHQDLPFGKMVGALGVDRDPSRSPVFQIAFTYAERDAVPVLASGVEFVLTDLIVGINAAKFDLSVLAEARAEGLWFECSYKTALFDAGTIGRLLTHFEVLLRGVAADPSARLSALPLLTDAERHREITGWNDTGGPVPGICVHEAFEAQVARTPDDIAAVFEAEAISYAGLSCQANQIARRLRAAGVGPEVLVGVCMRTGIRRLAALLGIWKAGGGYVPLDPALPRDRLSFMIADTAMAVVLADEPGRAALPESGATVICLDAEWNEVRDLDDSGLGASQPATARAGAAGTLTPANVAYVLFTSGSTGQPKGVVVEHRQVVNFVHGMIGHWEIGPSDAVLQFASLSFDVSVLDMFVPLLAGARVVLVPPETLHSPPRLGNLIRAARVSVACLPPAVLSLLAGQDFPGLRILLSAGEELPSELARRWLRPGLRFVNAYGPTETTVLATYCELDGTTWPPPIGRPCRPNYQAYVLDRWLHPVPVGATGELHIGGASVARGYLNRPELTAARFVADPFAPDTAPAGSATPRLYKTGDLARRNPDGTITYLGRTDHQIKIRGLRIEPGEIETALTTHPAITQALVTTTTSPAGDKELTAYCRPADTATPSPDDLRAHLAATLPGYMIPAHLIMLAEFPLTTSGKINRTALPAPHAAPPPSGHAAPATDLEAALTASYATVLALDSVGATDSFFHLGGNSLQVMRLVDHIAATTGTDLTPAAVFLHPTPRQLASAIQASPSLTAAGSQGPLIQLTTGPGNLPLVLIHPVGGTIYAYAPLAAELAAAFTVYGLQAPRLASPGSTPDTISDLADEYTQIIRTAQPDGPYRLAGWSMGGVLAFEITRRLEHHGAEVAYLTLLDAPFTIPADRDLSPASITAQFTADATASLGQHTTTPPRPATSPADQITRLARQLSTDTTQLRQRLAIFTAHTRMLAGYQPRPPAVRAPALIISATHSPNAPASQHWPAVLAGPVTTLPIDSDHYDFLRPPLVTDIAACILKWHGDIG